MLKEWRTISVFVICHRNIYQQCLCIEIVLQKNFEVSLKLPSTEEFRLGILCVPKSVILEINKREVCVYTVNCLVPFGP